MWPPLRADKLAGHHWNGLAPALGWLGFCVSMQKP
jgi:hypothetical protein